MVAALQFRNSITHFFMGDICSSRKMQRLKNTMNTLLMLLIISACEAQLTTKHSTGLGTCQGDNAVHEELKLLKEEFRTSNAKLEEALQENQKLVNESLSRLETEVKELRNEREISIASAFMAQQITTYLGSHLYDRGEKLIFSQIVYNQGNHYDAITGEYSCPVTGMYFFTYTLYGNQLKDVTHSRVYVGLHKTGQAQTLVFVQNNDDKYLYISISQAAVLQCNAGEKVWLETLDQYTRLYGPDEINVFSGILLRML